MMAATARDTRSSVGPLSRSSRPAARSMYSTYILMRCLAAPSAVCASAYWVLMPCAICRHTPQSCISQQGLGSRVEPI